MYKCFSYSSQNLAPSLLSSKQIFPVLPEWRSCPGARGRLLPFQRLVPVATLPGHILSSKGIIIFSTLVLQKHHFSDCLNHPKNEQKCPTGDLAPIPRDSCCPSKAECDNKNCSQVIERTSYFSFFQAIFPAPAVCVKMCVFEQVRCIVERCDDGSIAPVPEGQCCPSKRACPAQVLVLLDLMI